MVQSVLMVVYEYQYGGSYNDITRRCIVLEKLLVHLYSFFFTSWVVFMKIMSEQIVTIEKKVPHSIIFERACVNLNVKIHTVLDMGTLLIWLLKKI